MIRSCVSIALIFAITTNVVQFAIPLSWYLANYHHVSTELCINKMNPEIECNGMCQLKKRMTDDHDHHNSQSEHSKNIVDRNLRIDLFITEKKIRVPVSHLNSELWASFKNNFYLNWISEPVSPPPQLA